MSETKAIVEKKFTPPYKPNLKLFDNTQTNNMIVDKFLSLDFDGVMKEKMLNDINTKNQFGHTALHMACMKDDIERVKILLEAGASLNVQDDKGNTPLMHVAKKLNVTLVKKLIEYHPDLTIKNSNGKTVMGIMKDIYNEYVHYNEKIKEINNIIKILKRGNLE